MLIRYMERKIKNKDLKQDQERTQFGYFSSIIGIISNLILFAIKISAGLASNSISLIADSINNLSDTATSIVGLFGFKMSIKPADKQHPFGHGRTEYLSSLLVSFIIIFIGYELIKDSFDRIINPSSMKFDWLIVIILISTIAVKLWLAMFYSKMSKKIDSKVLKTASIDSLSDVWATSSVFVSFIVFYFSGYIIDGYVGVLVALFIIYNGFTFIKESVDIIIGHKPDFKLVKSIENNVKSYDEILSVHDIIVHDYGPMAKMVTAHVEISSNLSLLVAHSIIDHIERTIKDDLDISLLLHVDPIEDTCKLTNDIKEKVHLLLKEINDLKSVQDFRVVEDANSYTVLFELICTEDMSKDLHECKVEVLYILKQKLPYDFIITLRKENRFIH